MKQVLVTILEGGTMPVGTVRIEDRLTATEFEGAMLGDHYVSTKGPGSLRWFEVAVFRHDEGGYVIHRIGHSRVYHQAEGGCTTITGGLSGDPATVTDLPDDAASCDRCQPPWPEDLEDGEKIRFEFDRHTVDRMMLPAQVVERLTTMKSRREDSGGGGRRTRVVVSEPVRELLAMVTAADPEFAAAPKPVQRIS